MNIGQRDARLILDECNALQAHIAYTHKPVRFNITNVSRTT